MELTFVKAIELLEISDLSKVKIADLILLEKKAKKRWHPDKVAHLKDAIITLEYTANFQQIEIACRMINSYLEGTYQAGNAFDLRDKEQTLHEEPEEVIRRNAPDIQSSLRNLWEFIKEKKYKWSVKEVGLSDGYKLRDVLIEDFKEDIAMLSIVSFIYGLLLFGVLTSIMLAISPILGSIVVIIWLLHSISCTLGFLPLSRIWLNKQMFEITAKFINFGLGIYNWANNESSSSSWWVQLIVQIPTFLGVVIKYIVLFPLYELAKVIVSDKIIGVVKQNVNYYADAAEWYIDELISSNPLEMSTEKLFHLSYLYTELSDVKSKY